MILKAIPVLVLVFGLGLFGCGNQQPTTPDASADAGAPDGGASDGGLAWDDASNRDAEALCAWDDQCNGDADGMNQMACEADVRNDYRDARSQVTSEAECIQCMGIRAEELEASLASSCQTQPDTARIEAACGASKETCAGAP